MKPPNYTGKLAPAPWSGLRLSAETLELVRKAADKKCPACEGDGIFRSPDGLAHLCHCINREPQK